MKKKMKPVDCYHNRIEWSDEVGVYIGKCPNLITGIHGDDPIQFYAELCNVVEEAIEHFQSTGKPLPAPMVRLMKEAV